VYNYFVPMPKMSEFDMNYALTELKEQHPWLRDYHSKMLQMVCKQVSAARRVAKGKLRKLTYRYNFTAFTYNPTGFRIENNDGGNCDRGKRDRLSLSKIDSGGSGIRIVLHK
jgi:hypothetical protein